MAGGLGNSDNALNDYVSKIQGADQMSATQMAETKGTFGCLTCSDPLGIGAFPGLPIPDYPPVYQDWEPTIDPQPFVGANEDKYDWNDL
jgi:hypothetical protein